MKYRKIMAGMVAGNLLLASFSSVVENPVFGTNMNGKAYENIKVDENSDLIEDNIYERTAFPIGLFLTIFIAAYGLDLGYFKAERDQWTRVKNTYNGWVPLNSSNGKTLWFYKQNGYYKHGWHWDNYYKGWYYFYNVEFVVGDQTFSKLRWNANVMYDKANNNSWMFLNNKWYEFEIGGKLIPYSGWRKYNGGWLYHLPGDYGAIANQSRYIDGRWYTFNSNGYLE